MARGSMATPPGRVAGGRIVGKSPCGSGNRCVGKLAWLRARPQLSPARAGATSFEEYVIDLQQELCRECESLDGSGTAFVADDWQRARDTGLGRTRVIEGGDLFEKAAINVSIIKDILSEERAKAMSERGRDIDQSGGQPYEAAAMSLVFHPRNPMVPTLRADVRRFKVGDVAWYGGGADLTPTYLFDEDASSFHAYWKQFCDGYSPDIYGRFKSWCDRYFYIPARAEHRGVGGLFFDDLRSQDCGFDADDFCAQFGRRIMDSWAPIAERRNAAGFTQEQKDWQLMRRGRYIEFNLLYDRGIKFGLQGGRMESIMVSAPPLVKWAYNFTPRPGSEEERLLQVLREPRDWAGKATKLSA